MMEHWNTRQAQKLEAQMQRVSSQSQNLLVPITTHLQALMIGSLYNFVDSHFDDAKQYVASEYGNPDHGAAALRIMTQSPLVESPTDLKHPETSALWMSDVMRADMEPISFSSASSSRFVPADQRGTD